MFSTTETARNQRGVTISHCSQRIGKEIIDKGKADSPKDNPQVIIHHAINIFGNLQYPEDGMNPDENRYI